MPDDVVARLHERKIMATVAPYARPYVRLTASIVNTARDLE